MANIVAVPSVNLHHQGIRTTKRIEWIEVTFAGNAAADTVSYTLRRIKSIGAVIGLGFSYTVAGRDVTFVLPHAMAAGTHLIGLVEA